MNARKNILLLLAAALTAGSCSRERIPGGEQGSFTIRMEVPGASTVSRAFDDQDERRLETIDLLLFEWDGSQELFRERKAIDGGSIDNSQHFKTFQVPLPLSPTAEYRIVLLANARSQIESSTLTPNTEKEQLLASLATVSTSGAWNTSVPDYLPMWGETAQRVILPSTSAPIPSIPLIRSLARLDIEVKESLVTDGTFELDQVRVYNYHPAAKLVPAAGKYLPSALSVTAASLPGGSAMLEGPQIHTPATSAATAGQIYLAEHDDAPRMRLLVRGCYQGASQATWYEIPVADISAKTGDELWRNYRYRVTITQVGSEGATSPEAITEALPKLSVDVVAWNEYDLRDGELDAPVTLSADKTLFEFNADGRASIFEGISYYYYTDQKINIQTNAFAGWQVSRVTNEEGDELTGEACWTTLKKGSYHFFSSAEGNLTKDPNQWVVWAKPNTREVPRKAIIYITAGDQEISVEVSQAAMHGCGTNGTEEIWGAPYPVYLYVDSLYTQTIRCWMVENLRDQDPDPPYSGLVQTTYDGKQPGERGYYFSSGGTTLQNYCPPGWRVPTEAEASSLLHVLTGEEYVYNATIAPMESYPEPLKYWLGDEDGLSQWAGYMNYVSSSQSYGSSNWGTQGNWLLYNRPGSTPGNKRLQIQIDRAWDMYQVSTVNSSGINNSPYYPVRCVKQMDGFDFY